MSSISSRGLVWIAVLGMLGTLGGLGTAARAQDTFDTLKLDGAKLYSEKSYALAYDAWTQAAALDVPPDERRKLNFYLADSRWRSRPGDEGVEAARAELEKLVEANADDEIAAEALESLGDSWLALGPTGTSSDTADWNKAWEYYDQALAKWAAATDLDAARPRYLGIVWKATGPPTEQRFGWNVPLTVLANALEIAVTPENRARAHYFLGAYYWTRGGDPFSLRRAGREWEAALAEGPTTAVYESSLFHLAEWNERAGNSVWSEDGGLVVSPDFDEALELYRRFLEEFPDGDSPYSDRAADRINEITRPTLEINSSQLFLPGSEPTILVDWRNLESLELVAYRVDLATAFRPDNTTSPNDWLTAVELDSSAEVGRWSIGGESSRQRESREVSLPGTSEAGSYLVVATSGDLSSRALVSVSGVAAIVQSVDLRVVTMAADASTGLSRPQESAKLWRAERVRQSWIWTEGKPTDEADAVGKGVNAFDFPDQSGTARGELIFLGTASGQPFVVVGNGGTSSGGDDEWRIMVYADRAATRPGEPVTWKLIARKSSDSTGSGTLATPTGETLTFKILDPRGNEVSAGEVMLTEFGTAWGKFLPDTEMPLGEYRVEFRTTEKSVGAATLFRLEEYRLPEYKVTVGIAAKDDGAIRLGDSFEIEAGAEYYFGGAVSDATVKLIVREAPWQRWPFYVSHQPQSRRIRPPSQPGRVIREEEMKTGPGGKVQINIDTPIDSPNDLQYTVEARVVDATGREVVATERIVVARQGYFVDLESARRVVFPSDPVKVKISAEDANDHPVSARGTLTVTRERWREVWLNPRGREVTGSELAKLRRDIFPPPGQAGWRLQKRAYEGEEIKRVEVSLGTDGQGDFEFTPGEAGFYRVSWSGRDADGPPVTAQTNVWAASDDAQLAGYHADGVEIVVDTKVAPGQRTLPVLIATETSGRDVLFTVHAGGTLFQSEVVHVEEDAALIEVAVDPRFVPNVFLTAALVQNLQFHQASEEIEVPPYEQQLHVELAPQRTTLLPGESGTFAVALKDTAGNPVQGEFSLAVIDEAISAIQEDYAGDPLDFFFGRSRPDYGLISSSMSRRQYAGEVETDDLSAPVDRDAFSFGIREEMIPRSSLAMASPESAAAPVATSANKRSISANPPEVTVRTDFRAAAFWKPGIETDPDGRATVTMRYPESLTTWIAKVRATSRGAEFGSGETSTRTTKPLVARLQAPRFLVVGDSATVSGVLNNRTKSELNARTELSVEGLEANPRPVELSIEGESSAAATWTVKATDVGRGRLSLTAVGGESSDGLSTSVPILEDGLEVSVYASGKATDQETQFDLEISPDRREGSESLAISVTPSLAAAALDAIPYLIEYPYGCTEQTMSRFLPAAVTARTLADLGLDEASVVGRMFGGIDPGYLPKVTGNAPGIPELDEVVRTGLTRLASLQRADGSWPWWGGGQSDAFMTAYVIWGLRQAEIAKVPVEPSLIERGAGWLRTEIVNSTDDIDLQAWLLHALGAAHRSGARISPEEQAALENLWQKRDQLSPYGRALLTLAAAAFGDAAKTEVLIRNLRDGVTLDQQPGVSSLGVGSPSAAAIPTARWGSDGNLPRWMNDPVEATAFSLQALLSVDPESDLVEPAINWLVKNRRGARWSNTRNTAITLLAMNRYLALTKELGAPVSFEVRVNGKVAGGASDATALDGVMNFDVDRSLIRDGTNEISITRTAGDGPLYVAAESIFFSLENPIPPRGNEIFLRRNYQLYEPKITLLDGYQFDRVPWAAEQMARPNSRVGVSIAIEAKTDLEYVIIEDLKPAGLEAVQARSGMTLSARHSDGTVIPIYCELRDRKVALFASRLKQGIWTISYDLRAETAGDFSALPVTAHAMYAPEFRANGSSRRVQIGEPETP
ncbi:MAG: alpha-2-macroglobulin family protein [Chthoniobacterales bacterium]